MSMRFVGTGRGDGGMGRVTFGRMSTVDCSGERLVISFA